MAFKVSRTIVLAYEELASVRRINLCRELTRRSIQFLTTLLLSPLSPLASLSNAVISCLLLRNNTIIVVRRYIGCSKVCCSYSSSSISCYLLYCRRCPACWSCCLLTHFVIDIVGLSAFHCYYVVGYHW